MKAIMISIQPKWCGYIASGLKTIEVRKTRPKIDTPFKCYIYKTIERVEEIVEEYDSNFNLLRRKKTTKQWGGRVIGYFICDRIDDYSQWEFDYYSLLRHIELFSKAGYEFLDKYLKGQKKGYGWHISDFVLYDKPKDVGEFRVPCKFAYSSYEKGICYEDCIQGRFEDCRNFCLPLTSPPKSWQYVEEKQAKLKELKGEV